MKDLHPLASIAEPSKRDVLRGTVAAAWLLREGLGDAERLLDSQVPVYGAALESLNSLGGMALGLAATLGMANTMIVGMIGEDEAGINAAQLLRIAHHHCAVASDHLTNHFSCAQLLQRDQGSQTNRLSHLGQKEREYAARAAQGGRQAAHRALSKMIESWPDAYDRDEA